MNTCLKGYIMKTRLTILFVLGFLLLTMGIACSQPDVRSDYDNTDLTGIRNKLNVYVAMINGYSLRAHDSLRRYLSWVNPETGPTGKERYILYGLYTIADPSNDIKNTRQIASQAPAVVTLDNSALQYADAVEVLYPLLNQADEYYTQEDYKDDNAQKGRQLHPDLMAGFERLVRSDRALRSALESVMEQLELQEINAFKQNNDMFSYWMRYSMLQAKEIMKEKSNSIELIDLGALESAIKQYGGCISDLNKYVQSHPEETKGLTSLDMFITAHKDCLTAAKKLMRRKRDNKAYTPIEKKLMSGAGGWMVEGSLAQLLNEYNELIDRYNGL